MTTQLEGGYIELINMEYPSKKEALVRLQVMCVAEHVFPSIALVDRIFTSCKSDIRQSILQLQFWLDRWKKPLYKAMHDNWREEIRLGSCCSSVETTGREVGTEADEPLAVETGLVAEEATGASESTGKGLGVVSVVEGVNENIDNATVRILDGRNLQTGPTGNGEELKISHDITVDGDSKTDLVNIPLIDVQADDVSVRCLDVEVDVATGSTDLNRTRGEGSGNSESMIERPRTSATPLVHPIEEFVGEMDATVNSMFDMEKVLLLYLHVYKY